MDIPLVSIAPAGAAGVVAPIVGTRVAAATQAQTAAMLASQTTVDLSPLGRFLSAVSLFQKKILELQAGPAPVTAQQDSGDAFEALAASAVGVADTANALQASSLNGTSDDQSLATLFGQQFAAQAAGEEEGDRAQLAAIGLTFSSASESDEGGVLQVDTALLRAALEADPEGTTALLARTATTFGSLAGIAPGASVDPSSLIADAPATAGNAAFDAFLPSPAAGSTDPFPLPGGDADGVAPPLTSDAAFFQELLAEAPRPALAQAAPQAVAEANANFEAQAVADANALAADEALGRAQNGAPPSPPNSPPNLPPTASDTARNATASIGAARSAQDQPDNAAAIAAESKQRALADQAAEAQAARTLADQAVAAQNGAREAKLDSSRAAQTAIERQAGIRDDTEARAIDQASPDPLTGAQTTRTLAEQAVDAREAARDVDERLADSILAQRAAFDAQADARTIDEAADERTDALAVEQRRLDRLLSREALADEDGDPGAPRFERVTTTAPQAVTADEVVPAIVPRPLPPPVNLAQQAARDPAIAAAIAAYNLNAGPFAVLNGKPEAAAPKIKTISAVDNVTRAAPIEDDGPTSNSARTSR